jgi:hypothetical protein
LDTFTQKDWKKFLDEKNWHPASCMFPMMGEEDSGELAHLVGSIKSTGLQNPIVLLKGKVVDGRNRLKACAQAGVEPLFVEWVDDGKISIEGWVAAQNAQRRNLTPSQLAYAAIEASKHIHPTEEEKRKFCQGGTKWDKRIFLCNMFGTGRHYYSDMEGIDRWARGESWNGEGIEWRWPKGASRPRLDILESIKTGVHSISSACRMVDYFIAQANDPTITEQEMKDCPTGQLASEFVALIPKHIMEKAYKEASQWLKGEKLVRLKRYWQRMDKEYTWNDEKS